MRSAREATELRQYFAIKTDLAAAVRDAAPDDIDFHLNELATMQMHTASKRLRAACRASAGGRWTQKAVVNA
jgi:hypothetical protein